MCRNWSDADDIVQDCYLRALQNWRLFDARASRKSWLFAIARNACTDWFRKNRPAAATLKVQDISERTDDDYDRNTTDDIELVWQTVATLDTSQAEVINLRFAVGLSYAEIAQALDIPVGTVRSRLHRGLKAVRAKIEELENGS
jgi:RNA polymerase sigma-70 factor (ECF subfamily)